ncbi:hypothetical protein H8356DRAFT_1407625 [Neocallimastix lanati (nom. inval.)]|nr:hypothetical protein H8356DRAFT_1407625 [Neocallimastix sp. JGI-2020a]
MYENIISSNKFLNGSNYRIWYDSIKIVVEQLELEEYLEKVAVQELYDNDFNKKWALTLKVHNSSNRRDRGLKIGEEKNNFVIIRGLKAS